MAVNSPAPFLIKKRKNHVIITIVKESKFDAWLKKQNKAVQELAAQNGFNPKGSNVLILRDAKGRIEKIITGVHDVIDIYDLASTAENLTKALSKDFIKGASFQINSAGLSKDDITNAHIGWAMAGYKFDRYKARKSDAPALQWGEGVDKKRVNAFVESMYMVRSLINTPSNDMGPADLEKQAKAIAKAHTGRVKIIKDKDLIKENMPMIFAVGDSSPRRPRLIDLKWGNAKHPKLTLVGKGVCFDTGGLDIKPSAYMKLMKKDMGGAAHVLGLANMIMALKLPVRLRVLIPAVENSVSGVAFRPGDVFTSRKGLTIENTNTDAEGRLVLSDCLTLASEEKPDLIIDFATLTGSARAALGPDVPPFFTNDDKTAKQIEKASKKAQEPVWRMPLYQPYKETIESSIADLLNSASVPGDLIYSALFLERFLVGTPNWVHMDIFAWELSGRSGRASGGADTGLRAIFTMIEDRYGK